MIPTTQCLYGLPFVFYAQDETAGAWILYRQFFLWGNFSSELSSFCLWFCFMVSFFFLILDFPGLTHGPTISGKHLIYGFIRV